MSKKKISVVTPCYNEVNYIENCIETIKSIFAKELQDYDLEHIICDNASTDGTVEKLEELAAKNPQVKVIFNEINSGILLNTFNGVINSSGDATLMFMPVDLQDPPELIPEFVRKWEEGIKIVYGIRDQREEFFLMKWARKLYYRLLSFVASTDYPPDVGDFQLVDKTVVDYIRHTKDVQPFIRMMTFETGQSKFGIKYTWGRGVDRKSKNSLSDAFGQGMNGLVNHSVALTRFCLGLGLFLSGSSILYAIGTGIYILLDRQNDILTGIPTLLVGLFFFCGLQLFFIGILGEYIVAIFTQLRGSNRVRERKRLNFVS